MLYPKAIRNKHISIYNYFAVKMNAHLYLLLVLKLTSLGKAGSLAVRKTLDLLSCVGESKERMSTSFHHICRQGWGEFYLGARLAQNDIHEDTKNIVLEHYSSTDFPVLVLVCSVLAPALYAADHHKQVSWRYKWSPPHKLFTTIIWAAVSEESFSEKEVLWFLRTSRKPWNHNPYITYIGSSSLRINLLPFFTEVLTLDSKKLTWNT